MIASPAPRTCGSSTQSHLSNNTIPTGVAPATLEWLAHLVRTRVLYVMPMTNAVGYDGKTR